MKIEGSSEIQIRKPVKEEENKDYEKKQKELLESQKEKYNMNVDSFGRYLSTVTKNGGSYSETMMLDQKGEIDSDRFMINAGRTILEGARSVDISKSGLDKLISGIKEKFLCLDFSLNEKEGQLTLVVKNMIKEGSSAQWVSRGSDQWLEPKKIIRLSDDGLFAFVDGTMTGIPVEQLRAVNS